MSQKNGPWGSESEPKFKSLPEALEDRRQQLRKSLVIAESQMIDYVFQDIHIAYYLKWQDDAHRLQRLMMQMRRRVARAKPSENAT